MKAATTAGQVLLAALASSASAARLYVASYNNGSPPNLGAVTTLEFSPGLAKAAASIKAVAANTECGSAPTWLDQTLEGKLICVDEGFATPNASLNALAEGAQGALKSTGKADTIQGPVSTQFYNDNTAVALAHFAGGAIQTFKVSAAGAFSPLQTFTFSITPGPKPEQAASHVHQAVIDPTQEYIVFPDLGADVVRVFRISKETGLLTEQASLKAKPGYGPRHAVFWSPDGNKSVFLFVINELENSIVSFRVGYLKSGGLTFKEVDEVSTYGDRNVPAGAKAAEIAVSPDNNFIIASNRNAPIFTVPNPDPRNSTVVPSDSIATFKPSQDGKLQFVELAASGGSFPRHFSTNKDGSQIAIANQNSFTVDFFARDVTSGKIGDRIASAVDLPGPVTYVAWAEE